MKKAFTLMELMIVMLIIGIGLMSVTPRIASKSVGQDPKLEFFNTLIKEQWQRSLELSEPVILTGFKGSSNILTHDGESKTIPENSVKEARINMYETRGNEYAVRIYPDGICDYFEIVFNNGDIVESVPLLMTTRYQKKGGK